MPSAYLREQLRDPAYLDLHLLAAAVVHGTKKAPWYDAYFLQRYHAALEYLRQVRPEKVEEFASEFDLVRPSADFTPAKQSDILSPSALKEIRQVIAELSDQERVKDERENFGRDLLRNHPALNKIESSVRPVAEELAGRELEFSYSFLSLYGGKGKCEPHMDEPISAYTLDICVEQNVEWPIYFSEIIDWPSYEDITGWDASSFPNDCAASFTSHTMQPNEALFFAGNSQWHYRNPIPDGGFCNLIFYHYYPKGCDSLVRPTLWATHFNIPELKPLCDIFAEQDFGY